MPGCFIVRLILSLQPDSIHFERRKEHSLRIQHSSAEPNSICRSGLSRMVCYRKGYGFRTRINQWWESFVSFLTQSTHHQESPEAGKRQQLISSQSALGLRWNEVQWKGLKLPEMILIEILKSGNDVKWTDWRRNWWVEMLGEKKGNSETMWKQ